MAEQPTKYRIVKTKGTNTGVFLDVEDPEALDTVRARHGNRDLEISATFYEDANPSSQCTHALCFHIRSNRLEQARQSTLEVVYYLAENYGIPQESVDLIYDGGGIVPEDDNQHGSAGGRDDQTSAGTAAPAEMAILVPPGVFAARPTPLALALNHALARQMREDGIGNLEIDIYVRDHFVPLPDSVSGATGRFVVRLSVRELLYLSPKRIRDLANQPRGNGCLAAGHLVPEAAEWFAEALAEMKKQARQQVQLREQLLRLGWVVLPCTRRLDWVDMSEDSALEACRIIARFYPFVGAGEDEVWYHIHRVSKRHVLQQGARLRAIVTFGNENPAFVGCEHPLLRQFCPAGGCFMKRLLHDLQSPRLFT